MGTNYYLRRVKPVTVHPEMHIAKISAGWRIHFQDSTEGVEPCYFEEVDEPRFHSVREIRAILERGEWQLADEYGETWAPGEESVAKFDELCRWNGGPGFDRPAEPYYGVYDHEPEVPYDHAVGGSKYRDADGYVFDERWFG